MAVRNYPKGCRKAVKRISGMLCVSAEAAWQMMLTTAALMDLRPGDPEVTRMILLDCGIEDAEIA